MGIESAANFSSDEVSRYYAIRLPHLKQRRAVEWRGPCPIHHGNDDNFAVEAETGRWFCHSKCGRGGDIFELEAALKGGNFSTRKAEVFRLLGRISSAYRDHSTRSDGNLGSTYATEPAKRSETGKWHEVARYPYVDQDGIVLFEVVRYLKPDGTKTFVQLRSGGLKATDCPRVPYRLPELLNSETVYLAEREKDVHTLEEWGLVASCNPGGCGNGSLYSQWKDYFRGRHIVILLENDEPGRKHAAAVAAALLSVVASLRIVELPDLVQKGDITDWRDAGGTFACFRALTEAAVPVDAAALSELRVHWELVGRPTE